MSYLENYTFEGLIEKFVWEYGRINQKDRKQTQSCIKKEINRRVKSLLLFLEKEEQMKDEITLRDAEDIAHSLMKFTIDNGKDGRLK